MQPRCAMRFDSHIPKSLAMRKSFFASDAKTHSLDLKSQENARKRPAKILRCWPAMRKIGVFLRSSDAKRLQFGLPLRFGLRCEHPRCQIASDVGFERCEPLSASHCGNSLPFKKSQAAAVAMPWFRKIPTPIKINWHFHPPLLKKPRTPPPVKGGILWAWGFS